MAIYEQAKSGALISNLDDLLNYLKPSFLRNSDHAVEKSLELARIWKESPQDLAPLQKNLTEILVNLKYTRLFSEGGILNQKGFFSDLMTRIGYKILPPVEDKSDARTWLRRQFSEAAFWIEEIPISVIEELFHILVNQQSKLVEYLDAELISAIELVSLKLTSISLNDEVYDRLSTHSGYGQVFLELARVIQTDLLGVRSGKNPALAHHIETLVFKCEKAAIYLRDLRYEQGASLSLTFEIIRVFELSRRLRILVHLYFRAEHSGKISARLFRELIHAECRRFDIKKFFTQNVELLAFEVTEHAGRAGEHYISDSKQEYLKMFRSALLGGGIVALLVINKFLIAKAHFPIGLEAILNAFNYAFGFVIIFISGGVLATKQPAMTAAAIASAIDKMPEGPGALKQIVELLVRIARTQNIALFGNLVAVVPLSFVISYLLCAQGLIFMDIQKAHMTLQSLHPYKSLSLFYATLTGILLFTSGLVAGYFNNWFIFQQVGKRIPSITWTKKWMNTERLNQYLSHHLGAIMGNVFLGVSLGILPAVGTVLGLPLDIRHITFAAGQFIDSLVHLNFDLDSQTVIMVAIGVLGIGITNLIVSFSLALYIALKSRKVRFSQTWELIWELSKRILMRPKDILYPPVHK